MGGRKPPPKEGSNTRPKGRRKFGASGPLLGALGAFWAALVTVGLTAAAELPVIPTIGAWLRVLRGLLTRRTSATRRWGVFRRIVQVLSVNSSLYTRFTQLPTTETYLFDFTQHNVDTTILIGRQRSKDPKTQNELAQNEKRHHPKS